MNCPKCNHKFSEAEQASLTAKLRTAFSSSGGAAGRGAGKARDRSHYVAAAKKRWDKVRAGKAKASQAG